MPVHRPRDERGYGSERGHCQGYGVAEPVVMVLSVQPVLFIPCCPDTPASMLACRPRDERGCGSQRGYRRGYGAAKPVVMLPAVQPVLPMEPVIVLVP